MASIVDDPRTAKRLAHLPARAFIKTHHSLAAVGRQMRDRLVSLGLL